MLDVGRRGGDGAHDRGVEKPARGGEQGQSCDAAQRLETARRHVLVGHRITGGMGEEAEVKARSGSRPEAPTSRRWPHEGKRSRGEELQPRRVLRSPDCA